MGSVREREKNTIRLGLGRSQPSLPFPIPMLSLATPSKRNEEGGITDRNMVSAHSQCREVMESRLFRSQQNNTLQVSCVSFQQLVVTVTQCDLGHQTDRGLHLDPTFRDHKT